QPAQETSETASAMLAQAEAAYAAQAASAPAPAVQQGAGYLVDNALINALQSVRELSINEVDTKLNELANLLAMRGQAVNAQQYRRLTLLAVLQIKQDWSRPRGQTESAPCSAACADTRPRRTPRPFYTTGDVHELSVL